MDPSIVLNCWRKSGIVHENSEVATKVSDNEGLFGDKIDDKIQRQYTTKASIDC